MARYSVVIIAKNEEACIGRTIRALLEQTVPPHRVVVVDNGSTDATPEICSELGVDVVQMSGKDFDLGSNVYSNRLHDLRNAGMAKVRDDPVDWVYSGDADIVLPHNYCEDLMRHAEKHGAYIAAGILPENPTERLPMDGCRMIQHAWLRSVGMYSRWDSVYLCVKAIAAGHSTLVRHAGDCTVESQRPTGDTYKWRRLYNASKMSRKMGAPRSYMILAAALRLVKRGPWNACIYLAGAITGKVEAPEEMVTTYRHISGAYLIRNRKHARNEIQIEIDGNRIVRLPPKVLRQVGVRCTADGKRLGQPA